MIVQIKKFEENALAIEVVDGFTEVDEKEVKKFFQEKLDQGHDHVNLLIKLDEAKIGHSSIKAFMEETIWILRNFKHLGNLAIVAHSKIVKALVPIDSFFFERLQKGYKERYFDVSQMDEAMELVTESK